MLSIQFRVIKRNFNAVVVKLHITTNFDIVCECLERNCAFVGVYLKKLGLCRCLHEEIVPLSMLTFLDHGRGIQSSFLGLAT